MDRAEPISKLIDETIFLEQQTEETSPVVSKGARAVKPGPVQPVSDGYTGGVGPVDGDLPYSPHTDVTPGRQGQTALARTEVDRCLAAAER